MTKMKHPCALSTLPPCISFIHSLIDSFTLPLPASLQTARILYQLSEELPT